MRACTSTSESIISARGLIAVLLLLVSISAFPGGAQATEGAGAQDRTQQPEEEDFESTPYTEYGEFNEEEDEAADMKFYQFGRLFGFGMGIGASGATGNRGKLWKGGFPLIDVRTQYFFDFNVAMGISFTSFKHNYEADSDHYEAAIALLGLDFKYYFDTKDLSAPISFANPYIVGGMGSYSEALEASTNSEGAEKDSSFGINAGLGLEFAIKPKKSYFTFEGRFHSVRFKDTSDARYTADGFDNLEGVFYTVVGGFLFTW
jgi:hypothetical protein